MKFYKQIKTLATLIPYPELEKAQSFVEWKNRLLFVTLTGLAIIGFIAYIPSVILSVKEQLWAVVAVDTIAYLILLIVIFSKKISAESKVKACLITFYILGVAILVLLGKEGAGFNWLFVFPILSSFFYGDRGFIGSALINIVTLSVLTIPVYFGYGEIAQYDTGGWVVNSINFIAITSFISFSLMIVISNIDKSLKKQKKMTRLLRENKEKLAIEKNRAEESDKLKSAFLANMSHEIRTPLNAILGFSDLLANQNLSPEKFNHYNSLISMAGDQLTRIIEDIIDISKIELNQISFDIGPVQIYDVMQEIVETQENKIKSLKKDIRIDFQVDKKIENLVIETDVTRFKQILNNLIGNAVKYTDSGKIETGYILKKEDDSHVVDFFIKDTGRGIPEEAHELIFDRFSQAENVGFQEGTGLGLSITKGLLEMLGGKIRFTSELNRGSNFYFTLPLPMDSESILPSRKKETKIFDQPQFNDKTFFIAEDDNNSFYYVSEILQPTGARLRKATTGKELIQLLAEEIPDLILLDINMPEMNGLEAMKIIHKIYPRLPVLAQTAYAMENERNKCFEYGCCGYIAKPFRKEELLNAIQQALKH